MASSVLHPQGSVFRLIIVFSVIWSSVSTLCQSACQMPVSSELCVV